MHLVAKTAGITSKASLFWSMDQPFFILLWLFQCLSVCV